MVASIKAAKQAGIGYLHVRTVGFIQITRLPGIIDAAKPPLDRPKVHGLYGLDLIFELLSGCAVTQPAWVDFGQNVPTFFASVKSMRWLSKVVCIVPLAPSLFLAAIRSAALKLPAGSG